MRITHISARDVFSFADLDLPVGPDLTVITGPNGAGKSSLARLLRLARMAVDAVSRGDTAELTREYARAGRFGAEQFRVAVAIEFDSLIERNTIEQWARAALVTSLAGPNQQNSAALDAALPDNLGGADALAVGVLTIDYDAALRSAWRIRWEVAAGVVDLAYNNVGSPSAPNVTPMDWLRERGDPIAAVSLAGDAKSTFTLTELLGAGRFELAVRPTGLDAEPHSLQAVFRAVGLPLDTTRSHVGLARVMNHLLGGLIVSDAYGRGEMAQVPLDALGDPTADVTDEGIGARLLRRKTGGPTLRAGYDAALGVFRSLTGSELDVVAQTIDGPRSEESVLTATPVVPTKAPSGATVDIPLRLSGQGLVEAARLALLLSDPAHTLLLDEPATALSAVAQRRLLSQLVARGSTRQTIVITHSTHLVPVSAADVPGRIIRLTPDATGATVVHRVRSDLAEIGKHRRLLGSADIRDALFAAAVWLVEGATDEEAIRTWLSESADGLPTLETAHVLVVSVNGADNFPRYAELMAELGIPYGILADGPALRAGGALRSLRDVPDLSALPDTFAERAAAWATVGVRTLATDYHDDGSKLGEIEAFFEHTNATVWKGIRGDGKIRRGAAFAAQVPVPESIVQLWRDFLGDVGVPL